MSLGCFSVCEGCENKIHCDNNFKKYSKKLTIVTGVAENAAVLTKCT
jgi:hypothetical protein